MKVTGRNGFYEVPDEPATGLRYCPVCYQGPLDKERRLPVYAYFMGGALVGALLFLIALLLVLYVI
jgi:hypothetical protein